MVTNVAASTKQKLMNYARGRGEDFNLVLIRYIHERLLYRMSQSSHADVFVLKGASLFTVWQGAPHRATKDLDLLGNGAPDLARLRALFVDICSVPVDDDGLAFDTVSIDVETIREEAVYDGVRLRIAVAFGNARTVIQIDVGFGDVVVPPPSLVDFPVILDLPKPRIRVYAKETVIAEKFQAMVELGMSNSRMKDFYDIHFLLSTFEFESATLAASIQATFERRRMQLPKTTPVALTPEFYDNVTKQRQWEAFCKRAGAGSALRLPEVAHYVCERLLPLVGLIR